MNKILQRFVSTKPMAWFFLNVFPHIDRPLLRLTKGRLSASVGQPILLLTTTGAKSGQERTTPLIYFTEGDDLFVIASAGGRPKHPAWYHNLRAHPEVTLTFAGRTGRYRARITEGEERDALWTRACDYYLGFRKYQEWAAGRRVPVVVFSPAA